VPAALRGAGGAGGAGAKKSTAAVKAVDAAEADEDAAVATETEADAPTEAGEAASDTADTADTAAGGAVAEGDVGAEAGATGDASGEDADDDDAAEDADAAQDAEPEDDGLPVFEVSDRRGSITADRAGVTFRLDSEIAEFGWDEIQAVEFDTARFGRRFSVTVYTGPRRWFESDVEAPSRSALKRWATELDAVLDARFEEGAASPEGTEEGVAAAGAGEPAEV
jgi:hypothetical protein